MQQASCFGPDRLADSEYFPILLLQTINCKLTFNAFPGNEDKLKYGMVSQRNSKTIQMIQPICKLDLSGVLCLCRSVLPSVVMSKESGGTVEGGAGCMAELDQKGYWQSIVVQDNKDTREWYESCFPLRHGDPQQKKIWCSTIIIKSMVCPFRALAKRSANLRTIS